MSNTARIGYGSVLTYKGVGGSGTDEIGQVTDIAISGIALATVDATHMDSEDAFREFIAGLLDAGELTFTVQSQPANSGSADNWHVVKDAQENREVGVWELEFPTGAEFECKALVTNIGVPTPLEDKITTNVTLKLSGKPTWSNA